MANEKDDVLLKLVIQGQSPAELAQLAQQTGGQLEAQMKVHLDRITELHKQAGAAQTAEAVKATQAQLKAEQTKLSAVKQVLDAEMAVQEKLAAQATKAAQQAEKAATKRALDEQKAADKSIKEAERTAAAQEKAAKQAANAQHNAIRRTLEDMENLTVAGFGVKSAFEAIFGRGKELAEEIIRVSQIYGSLKGSIDSLRSSTDGEVADIDLISAKNRALEKELQLLDRDFGTVALAAKKYADAIGTDTKEALDGLIDGLATGRLKTLQAAGIILDADKAYETFARTIGKSTKELSDHEKALAIQRAALQKMNEKLGESEIEGKKFGSVLEQSFATVKNAWTGLLASLGNSELIGGAFSKATDLWMKGVARISDQVTLGLIGFEASRDQQQSEEAQQRKLEAEGRGLRAKLQAQRDAVLKSVTYDKAAGPEYDPEKDRADTEKRVKDAQAAAKRAAEEFKRAQEAVRSFFDEVTGATKERKSIDPLDAAFFMEKGDKQKLLKDYLKRGEVAIRDFYDRLRAEADQFQETGGILPSQRRDQVKEFVNDYSKTLAEVSKNRNAAISDLAEVSEKLGRSVDQNFIAGATADEIKERTALIKEQSRAEKQLVDQREEAIGRFEGATGKLSSIAGTEIKFKVKSSDTKEQIDAQAAEINAIVSQYNPKGLKGQDLGPLGGLVIPVTLQLIGQGKTVEEFKDVAREVNESVQAMQSMVTSAYTSMAQAVGQSFAAQIAGSKEARKSFRDTTHDILEALSAQALTQAIFETAKGIAATAAYIESYGADVSKSASAVEHFAAAAAFGAVGVGAGLAARAVGKDAAPASASGGGLRQTGQGFNNPRGANDNGQQDTQKAPPINLIVFPGGEPEAGRAVVKALKALEAEDGIKRTVAY